jgi:hypothetical protein
MTAVASSRGQAVEFASRGNQIVVGREDPVYLVRMEGEFFLDMPRPSGSPLPIGRFLFVVFDSATLGSTDISLSGSDSRPAMSTLGPVTNLMEYPSSMTLDTRIVLRGEQIGLTTDPIVDHPRQPGHYTYADGTVWAWQLRWRIVDGIYLRLYDLAASANESN